MIIMSKFYKLSDFYSKELLKHQKCLRPGTHPCPVHIYTKKYAASKRHSAFFIPSFRKLFIPYRSQRT